MYSRLQYILKINISYYYNVFFFKENFFYILVEFCPTHLANEN